MPMKIVILEDNPDRQRVMRDCLADRFTMYTIRFFDDAAEMIRFLEANLADTLAIALDHDLEMKAGPEGHWVDPGTGRDVADFLASRKPVCPIVIHSTNSDGAIGMQMKLKHAGWKVRRVFPMEDTQWVPDRWFPAMRRAIVGPIGTKGTSRNPPKSISPAG